MSSNVSKNYSSPRDCHLLFGEIKAKWEKYAATVAEADTSAIKMASSGNEEYKKIAKETKDFRNLQEADRKQKIDELLKSFQHCCESLLKRCRTAEKQLTDLFRTAHKLPDISYDLDVLQSELSTLQEIVNSSRGQEDSARKLEALEKEMQCLHNQEITVRKLEEEVQRLHDFRTSEIEEKCRSIELACKRHFAEAETELEHEIRDLRRRNEDLLQEISFRDSQIFKFEEQKASLRKSYEDKIDLISSEVEFMKESSKRSRQSTELETSPVGEERERTQIEALNDSEKQKLILNSSLMKANREIADLQNMLQDERTQCERIALDHQSELKKLQIEIEDLNNKLMSLPSHTELEQQKKVFSEMQAIWHSDDKGIETSNLEKLLFSKQRHLESQLTEMRNTISSQISQITGLNNENLKAISERDEALKSIRNLECTADQPMSEDSSNASRVAKQQRDHFRTRALQLEQMVDELEQKTQKLEATLSRKIQDNIDLVEKVRFLQRSQRKIGSSIEDGLPSEVSSYDLTYEDEVGSQAMDVMVSWNPFSKFKEEEITRKRKTLWTVESLLLEFLRTAMSTRFTRVSLILYFTFLQLTALFVFLNSKVPRSDSCSVDGGPH